MKKRVLAKPQEAKRLGTRLYQCIMSGINKLFFFIPPSFHIKNEYIAYDELE